MKSGKATSPLVFSPCRAVVRNSGTPRILSFPRSSVKAIKLSRQYTVGAGLPAIKYKLIQ